MFMGRVASFYRLRLALSYAGTYSSAGEYGSVSVNGQAYTEYTSTSTALATGLFLEYEITKTSSGTNQCIANCVSTLLSINSTFTLTGLPASSQQYFYLKDVKLYCDPTGPYWIIKGSGWEWVVDGVTKASSNTAWSLNSSMYSAPLAPSSIPLLGVPLLVLGTASASGSNVIEDVYPDSLSSSATTFIGGWEIQELSSGSYEALPVSCVVDAPPAQTCTSGDIYTPDVSATDTSDATIVVESWCESDHTGSDSAPTTWWLKRRGETGYVRLIPRLDRTITRVTGEDYKALWFRWGYPQTEKATRRNCFEIVPAYPWGSPGPSPTIVTTEVHPTGTQMLSAVDDTVHTIEGWLDDDILCPYGCLGWASIIDSSLGSWFGYRESLYPYTAERHSDNADMEPYFDHAEADVRIVNWWANPHWHYAYWFPIDDPETEDQDVWQVDGAPITADYWKRLRTQWLYHSSLPVGEQYETRTTLPAACLLENGLKNFLRDSIFGWQTSWIGIQRFIAQNEAPNTVAMTSASEDAWSTEDAALTFGTDIEIANDGVWDGARTVELDLGRIDCAPYWLPHSAGVLVLGWTATNVDSITWTLEGVDGSTQTLAPTDGVAFTKAIGDSTKYFGSWAQNYGMLLVTDEGVDDLAGGISVATMANGERRYACLLLRGITAAKLIVVVTPTTPADPVNIDYPEFRAGAGDWISWIEHGSNMALTQASGPGIRYDNSYFDYVTDTFIDNPSLPNPVTAGDAHALGDWLCWRREALEGVDRESGLDTEIATLFDSNEYTQRAHLWRDPYSQAQTTHSFVWHSGDEIVGIMASSCREVPPLCTFPHRGRDATFQPSGDFCQTVWDWAVEPRRLVSAGDSELHLYSPADTQWTALASPQPLAGWTVTEHRHAVDNTETNFKVKQGTTSLATVRPWWTWLAVVDSLPVSGGVSYDVSASQRHVRAYLEGGTIRIGLSKNVPVSFTDSDTSIAADSVCVRWDKRSKESSLLLVYEASGTVYRRTSTDEGATWSSPVTIGTGSNPALVVGRNRIRYIYWVDGTAIKGQILDPQGNALASTFTAVASGVDDSPIAADESVAGSGGHRIVLLYKASGSVTLVTASDGKTFS